MSRKRRQKRNTQKIINNNNNSSNSNYRYIPIYNKEQYEKDEQNFEKSVKNNTPLDWRGFTRLFINDMCNSKLLNTECVGDYHMDDIKFALSHPESHWRVILNISRKLMHISPHYYRLNMLYSNMALFCWGIDLYGVKESANVSTIKKNYITLSEKLENMNMKHEFSKIMSLLPYQDIFCGVIVESQSDYFIQQIDFRICKLYEVQDGLYNFIINLSSISKNKIDAYPLYIKQAYDDFINGKIGKWYEPPADMQICIKMNEQWLYPYPLLIGLVKDLLDLDIYKKLKLQSARTDNFKAILIQIPIDDTTVDKPLLTPEALIPFAEINKETLGEDVGQMYSPGGKPELVNFKNSSDSRNNVEDAVDDIYDSSGLTKELFNGSSTATAITLSIENASGFVYKVYYQFERWVNRWIKLRKYNKSNYKFAFYLEKITIFNRDAVSNRYKDAITLGAPVIDKYLASLDMTPSRVLGSFIVHQDIFEFNKNFIPLQTSYNSSIDSETGRPTNESKGELLTESGERTQDTDANVR